MEVTNELLTVDDVCAQLNVSRWTVYGLIKSKELNSVKIKRCRRIPATALAEYVRGLSEEAA